MGPGAGGINHIFQRVIKFILSSSVVCRVYIKSFPYFPPFFPYIRVKREVGGNWHNQRWMMANVMNVPCLIFSFSPIIAHPAGWVASAGGNKKATYWS